tara:strand:- start:62 stop:508 length:447 start_codon:yes stop_codon:yes gene_type:complete
VEQDQLQSLRNQVDSLLDEKQRLAEENEKLVADRQKRDERQYAEVEALIRENGELRAAARTTLTGGQALTLFMLGPLFLAFVFLGLIIVWKTTSDPQRVGPYLNEILLAFSIFSNPVSAAAGVIVGLMSEEIKAKAGTLLKGGNGEGA